MQLHNEIIPISANGDLRRGGWLASGRVGGDTDAIAARQNWRVVGRSLAGWLDPQLRAAWNLHALGAPDFQFGRHESVATFEAGTVDAFLRGESIQDISFADVGSPANSHEATSWKFGQVITHILQHHCNYIYDPSGAAGSPDGVVTQTDIDLTNSTAFEVFLTDYSDNMWSVLQGIGGGEEGGGEFYRIWCDRRNVIHYQPAPPFISPQPAARGTLTKEHLRDMVQVQFHNNRPGERIGQVQLTATFAQRIITAASVFKASYPVNPGDGRIIEKDRVFAQSQGRANVLAERLYRWLTRSYTLTVEVDPSLVLFGDDGRGLDIADRVLMTYNGPAEDAITGAGVHLNLSAQSLFIYGINLSYDSSGRVGTATLTLEHDNSA